MNDKLLAIWRDPAKEIGEILLDEAATRANLDLLEKVPLISIGVAAWKSGHAWADYLLGRKVQAFYEGWEKMSGKHRHEVMEKFQHKPKSFTKKILDVLSVQEDIYKCKLIGNLTMLYLQNKISRSEFYDLIETISKLSYSDIIKFTELSKLSIFLPQRKVTERYAYLFIGRGLLESDRPPVGTYEPEDEHSIYKLTQIGKTLATAVKNVGLSNKSSGGGK